MAFKNIMIPEETRKEYEVEGEKIKPEFCTIDEDRKIMLFRCGTVFEEPDEFYFALIWKEKMLRVLLKQKVENKNTTIWKLLSICIPDEMVKCKNEIMGDLRDAMQEFGFDGNMSYLFFKDEKYLDKTAKTVISF